MHLDIDTMLPQILLAVRPEKYAAYRQLLLRELLTRQIEADIHTHTDNPASIDYVVYAPDGPFHDFSSFARLKTILSLWAGVESLTTNQTIQCPIARMVEPGMREGMTEWVTGQVLRHHLGFDSVIKNQDGVWRQRQLMPPLARNRCVAILGLGALGRASAESLKSLHFRVLGWSRDTKKLDGIDCKFGQDGLHSIIAEAEITVLMLPQTPETENLINSSLLAKFRRGSVLINPGRGALIDDDALLAALDSRQLSHATLDVFRDEPLPSDHPFWSHQSITVSPHIAADTRAESAIAVIAENVRRGECGEPYLYLVNQDLGY